MVDCQLMSRGGACVPHATLFSLSYVFYVVLSLTLPLFIHVYVIIPARIEMMYTKLGNNIRSMHQRTNLATPEEKRVVDL